MAFKLDFAALNRELDRRAALSPEERAAEDELEAANRRADAAAADDRRRDELSRETVRCTLLADADLRYDWAGTRTYHLRGVDETGADMAARYAAPDGDDQVDEQLAMLCRGALLDLAGFWEGPERGRACRGYEFQAQRIAFAEETTASA